ncbi:hypothetical protein ACIBI0_38545 [Microbispora rosea]|uniref:hypothetical protein n=1 Tax=Microbispora rosea TaxID=58117 RepID=UPI00379E05B9
MCIRFYAWAVVTWAAIAVLALGKYVGGGYLGAGVVLAAITGAYFAGYHRAETPGDDGPDDGDDPTPDIDPTGPGGLERELAELIRMETTNA